MKFVIALAFLVLASNSFAATKFICKEANGPYSSKRTMILTQLGSAKIEEGKKFAFMLEVFSAGSSRKILSEKVFVTTEDVIFSFHNSTKGIAGTIYMDELDQASLKLKGSAAIAFDCN